MIQRQKGVSADTPVSRSGDQAANEGAASAGSSRIVDMFPATGPGATSKEATTQGADANHGQTGDLRVEGKVTGVVGQMLTGWAWDAARPYEPVDVEVYGGNMKVGHGRADIFDLDLAKAKLGNGMHRFEMGLERLPPGTPPFILRFVVAGSDIELGPPVTLLTLEHAEHLLSASDYRGRVTGLGSGMIYGWVVNRRNPHERPTLNLRDGGVTVSTHLAGERSSETVEAGVVANVHRFEVPLPSVLLDGKLHQLTITAGEANEPLEGSPFLFGPADVTSFGRELTLILERLQKLDHRVQTLGPAADATQLQNKIAAWILDRIDTLLNVYRDSVERELAVMRRQLTRIMKQFPDLEADVIVGPESTATIEDEHAPVPAAFDLAARAAPLLTFDMTSPATAARALGGISRSDSETGLQITGEGTIELGENLAAPASLIIGGNGARDPLDFCDVAVFLDGHPLCGRVDVFDGGRWNYIGTTINGSVGRHDGLRIAFLTPPRDPLTIANIAVFGHGRAPFTTEDPAPQAGVVYLGVERLGMGWYEAEATVHGGLCWMGAQSETLFRLKPARAFVFKIPELRPLSPEILPKLQISIGAFPAAFTVSPLPGDSAAFAVDGQCVMPEETTTELVFRISFPPESVHSPLELGINADTRPLTIAVRSIALSAES